MASSYCSTLEAAVDLTSTRTVINEEPQRSNAVSGRLRSVARAVLQGRFAERPSLPALSFAAHCCWFNPVALHLVYCISDRLYLCALKVTSLLQNRQTSCSVGKSVLHMQRGEVESSVSLHQHLLWRWHLLIQRSICRSELRVWGPSRNTFTSQLRLYLLHTWLSRFLHSGLVVLLIHP